MQVALGWHPPFPDWHSSKSRSHPKWTCQGNIPKIIKKERPDKGATKRCMDREIWLTKAAFSISSEATETQAQVTPKSVDTLCKLTAFSLSRSTLIHILRAEETTI